MDASKLTPKLLKVAIVLFALNVMNAAWAADGGLFVEPGVTYQKLESETDWPAPFSNSTGEVQGVGLMARLGLHASSVVFFAADARYAMPNFKDSSNNLDADAKEWDIGPSVGIQMPIVGLRVWGTYILASELDPKESNNFDLKFTDGQGWRIGAGFRVAIVSLNLEYQRIKYDKTTIQKIGPYTPGGEPTNVDYDGEGFIASVSFPLSL